MDTELRRGFWLGDRHVAPLQGEITGKAGRQRVHPKAMEVLLCLAQAQGKVVERKRILETVWTEGPAPQVALTHCISELRHLLGDDAHRPTFIETVPGHGYRLLAPVTDAPSAKQHRQERAAESPMVGGFLPELRRRKVFRVAAAYGVLAWLIIQIAETTFEPLGIPLWGETLIIVLLLLGFPVALALTWALELTPQGLVLDRTVPRRRYHLLMFGAALIAVGSAAFYLFGAHDQPLSATSGDGMPDVGVGNSIAVLPFVSIGAETQNTYFADGLAEEVLGLLSQLDELQVAARSSSFYFRNKDITVAELSDRLGVNYLVGGTVRREGNEVRVRAELIDAQTGFEMWSDSYDRHLDDIFSIQSEIAQAVADQLELALSAESRAELRQAPTRNVRAYDLYIQARGLRRQAIGQAGMDAALEMFNRALSIDPEFAEAHAGICETYLDKYQNSYARENFATAERACQRALAFETTAAAVHTALGRLYLLSGRALDAEREFRRAIEVKVDAVDAHLGLGEALAARSQYEEAQAAIRRAIALEPGYWGGHATLAGVASARGDFGGAAESYRRVTELVPDNAVAFSDLGGALVQQGEFAAAADAFERSVELRPSYQAYSNIGAMYYYLGQFEKSVAFLEQAVKLGPEVHWLAGNLAASYRFAPGQQEESGAMYRKAVELAHRHLDVNPNDGDAWADLSLYYVNLGRLEEARAAMNHALDLSADGPEVHYYAALLHTAMKETEAAFTELERAVALGYDPNFLAADPELAKLRQDPRFEELFPPSLERNVRKQTAREN